MRTTRFVGLVIMLLACVTTSCQTVRKITFPNLEKELIEFLVKNGDIHNLEVEEYKNGKRRVTISGLYNDYNKGTVIDGLYSFYQNRTHARAYFLLVENNKYTILDISSRQGLDLSIKNTLDFCERNKYCVDITNDCISRIINVYYNINLNPRAGADINCESGVKDTKALP
jgi:hypothetical protein